MKVKKFASIVLLASCLLSGCNAKEVALVTAEKIPIAVEVQQLSRSSIRSEISYAGRINPKQSISVMSKMAGKVKEANYDIGEEINEGAVLFRLDEQDISNQIKQLESQKIIAEANVSSAENGLDSVTGGQYQTQIVQLNMAIENYKKQIESAELAISNSNITIDNANTSLDTAQKNFDNAQKLYNAGTLPKNDYDKAETGLKQALAGVEQAKIANNQANIQYEQATLALEQAEKNLELTLGQITEDNKQKAQLGINTALASMNSVQVQLDIAHDTLKDTAIVAPMSGVISAKNVKAGEFTSTQIAAYTIVDISKVNVEVKISEQLINSVYVGQEVDVYIKTIQSEPITGIIRTISPVADQTSTYPVKIEIDNPKRITKPGMFCEVKFVRASSENTLVIPRNCILEDEKAKYVYVAVGGVSKKIEVTTGIDNGKEIEITDGLTTDDIVIIKGQDYVTDGEAINITNN